MLNFIFGLKNHIVIIFQNERRMEKTLLLQHMLLSHHGKREMGAVTLPAIPEASILHHVDCMDAEMYMFRSAREETKPGEMSDKIFALDCRVYNPKN